MVAVLLGLRESLAKKKYPGLINQGNLIKTAHFDLG
jgi:hypothetical protein